VLRREQSSSPRVTSSEIDTDERQQRRAAAAGLLLCLRLRARPRNWRRHPTVSEDRHVSARQVPAFAPV